jgi:hypothetical protein
MYIHVCAYMCTFSLSSLFATHDFYRAYITGVFLHRDSGLVAIRRQYSCNSAPRTQTHPSNIAYWLTCLISIPHTRLESAQPHCKHTNDRSHTITTQATNTDTHSTTQIFFGSGDWRGSWHTCRHTRACGVPWTQHARATTHRAKFAGVHAH